MTPGDSRLSEAPATDVPVPNGALRMVLSVTSAAPGAAVAKVSMVTAVVPGVIAVVPGVLAVVAAGLGGITATATTAVGGVDETTVSADGFFAIGTCTTVRGCTSGACSSV